jgi:hypothetical protein
MVMVIRCIRRRRREDINGDDVESEVQHLVVGTFHTNLYHSLRNDWPTTPIALTRSKGTCAIFLSLSLL